jgi:hypothetical protein
MPDSDAASRKVKSKDKRNRQETAFVLFREGRIMMEGQRPLTLAAEQHLQVWRSPGIRQDARFNT